MKTVTRFVRSASPVSPRMRKVDQTCKMEGNQPKTTFLNPVLWRRAAQFCVCFMNHKTRDCFSIYNWWSLRGKSELVAKTSKFCPNRVFVSDLISGKVKNTILDFCRLHYFLADLILGFLVVSKHLSGYSMIKMIRFVHFRWLWMLWGPSNPKHTTTAHYSGHSLKFLDHWHYQWSRTRRNSICRLYRASLSLKSDLMEP